MLIQIHVHPVCKCASSGKVLYACMKCTYGIPQKGKENSFKVFKNIFSVSASGFYIKKSGFYPIGYMKKTKKLLYYLECCNI